MKRSRAEAAITAQAGATTTPLPDPSPARSVYLTAVIAAGSLVLLWCGVAIVRAFPGPAWLLLVLSTCVTAWFVVRLRGIPLAFSLSDAFTMAAALLFGPAAGALTVACDAAVMSTRINRAAATRTRVLFNITAPALAMFAAAHLFFSLSGAPPLRAGVASAVSLLLPLVLFAASYFLLNSALVAGALAIGRSSSPFVVWREQLLPLWPTHLGGAALALLLVVVLTSTTAGLPFTLVTLLALALSAGVTAAARRLRTRSAAYAGLRSYAAALRSTADAVVLADGEGLVTFLNPAAERLTGWSMAEARGRPVSDVVRTGASAEEDGDPAGAETPREYTLVRRDDTTVPIEQTQALIRDEDGVVSGVIRAFRDIRQRKQLEAERHALLVSERQARAAADAASRTKDEFLATLSHELRTPATAILGWTALLKSGRLDDARAHRALAALDRSARAQAAVLNDIVDVSRIVRGTLRLDMRRVNVGETVQEALDTVEPAAAAKRIDVRVHVEPSLPVVNADPDRIRQIVWNLLTNALKFTPDGGSVDVTVGQDGEAIFLSVGDTGCGIDPRFLAHVFDRFRQEDASDTRVHSGLGLGLSIVRHLVEAHGGTVRAESGGRGQGSRFTVTFPMVRRQRQSDVEPAAPPNTAGAGEAAHDAGYFEQLIAQMVRIEPAGEGWQAVLRADPSTFYPISTVEPEEGAEREVEHGRRLLAMLIAQALEAYGVAPDIPPKWQDRRDPRLQQPRPGGRRAMDFHLIAGGRAG